MAPSNTSISISSNLSPAELAYLHSSLSLNPPIRPDARAPTQFRPLVAETDILPSTNGSARICYADGTEAVVGVKAEVEKTVYISRNSDTAGTRDDDNDNDGDDGTDGQEQWVEINVDIPGFRDDDGLPIFLGEMLKEGLVGEGGLQRRLRINRGWHWKLYIDILLLSPPLSYPLPLLSLTTHLALISTLLPALKSQAEEDPLFDDDWAAAVPLYPRKSDLDSTSKKDSSKRKETQSKTKRQKISNPSLSDPDSDPLHISISRPPVTLLVICVGQNTIFDPSAEEIAAAEAMVAITITERRTTTTTTANNRQAKGDAKEEEEEEGEAYDQNTQSTLTLRAMRMIDPPARTSQPGGASESAILTTTTTTTDDNTAAAGPTGRVWRPPRGGIKRDVMTRIIKMVLEKGGVGEEVLAGLDGVSC